MSKIVSDLNNPTIDEIMKITEMMHEYWSKTEEGIIPTITSFALGCGIPVDYLEEYIEQNDNLRYEYGMMMTKFHNEMLKGAFGKSKINPIGAQFILETKFGYSKKEKEKKNSIYSNMSDEELEMQLERAKGELSSGKE